jgi:diguanylate cyclase (GGDEF)-like protein
MERVALGAFGRISRMGATRSFWMKHKVSLIDLGIMAAALGVAGYIAFAVDIFANESGVSEKKLTLELDEMLLLGGLLALGLLAFAVRRYFGQKREIVRRTSAEYRARELAYQDPLTGLANRRQFLEALDIAVKSPAGSQAAHALFVLDLNHFKQVNDIYGHGIGDEVLIVVAQRLLGVVRENGLVARLGGDEFAILVQHLMGPEAAATVAQRVIAAIEQPIVTGAGQHTVGVGIGIAMLDNEAPGEIIRKADVALYRAKSEQRSAFRFFAAEMDATIRERAALERDLRAAVRDGKLETSFAPIVDLTSGRIVSFEVTPRWTDPQGTEIPALRFIPVAEETGIIHALGEATLRDACAAAAAWPAEVSLTIDLYPGQLRNPDLPDLMIGILEKSGIDPRRLEVEISESVLVQNPPGLRDAFGRLRAAGIRIALDHFGTGYSTLYHLREFKLDRIKLDRSFVESDDPEALKVAHALAGLGHGLGIAVSTDGLDDLSSSKAMLASGIGQGQGNAFGPALNAEQALAALGSQRISHRRAG